VNYANHMVMKSLSFLFFQNKTNKHKHFFLSKFLVHRIFVVNEVGDTVGLMSQARVLEFLLKHKEKLSPQILQIPIETFSKKVKMKKMKKMKFKINIINKIISKSFQLVFKIL